MTVIFDIARVNQAGRNEDHKWRVGATEMSSRDKMTDENERYWVPKHIVGLSDNVHEPSRSRADINVTFQPSLVKSR